MTSDQFTLATALASMAASFGAPALEKLRPFGATLLRWLALAFAAASLLVLLWGERRLLTGIALATSLVVLHSSLYWRMRALGDARRSAEQRAVEAKTEAELARNQLEAAEQRVAASEAKNLSVDQAVERNEFEVSEMKTINETTAKVDDLIRVFDGDITPSTSPPSGEWRSRYYPRLQAIIETHQEYPRETGAAYSNYLSELKLRYGHGTPKGDHEEVIDHLRRLLVDDRKRLTRILLDRSNRLTKLISENRG